METKQVPIAFSGKIPQIYDAYLGTIFFEPYANDLANRVNKIKPKSLLEIAAGTGRVTRMLSAAIAKDGKIIASDINPAMVAFGKEQTKNNQIEWMQIDAHSLPFEDS